MPEIQFTFLKPRSRHQSLNIDMYFQGTGARGVQARLTRGEIGAELRATSPELESEPESFKIPWSWA